MVIAAAFFVAVAILCCASADSVTTSLLLPDALFVTDESFPSPTFVGQVTVTRSTTYYTLDCFAGGAATYFDPGYTCESYSYTFSESSASTQYLVQSYGNLFESGAASSFTEDVLQTSTIDCSPLGTSSSALCTTTFPSEEDDSSTIPYTTSIESGIYTVIFTAAAGYNTASSTVATTATPSPTPSAPIAKPTPKSSPLPGPPATAHPALAPSSKVGIGLGVPLGACALAGVALLLYRHGKHKERSRVKQMGNLAPPGGFALGSEGKKVSDGGGAVGRQPPVYSMEMQG